MTRKKTKHKSGAQSDNSCYEADGCLLIASDGCLVMDGCSDTDGCLGFDGFSDMGGCFEFDGCTTVFFVPFRLFVILGLMIYGDWDYANHRAKSAKTSN